MLGINKTKQQLEAGQEVFGVLNSIPCPLLCEMFGHAGYEFVIIDTEHLLVNADNLQHAIRAAEISGITPLMRIPSSDSALIARALDSGAQGIVIPRVSSVQQAREAVAAVRYPPLGQRGISGGRTTGFGNINLDDYIVQANREIMLVLMIEDPAGCEALAEIVKLPGIDMILEGALDLSIAMGHGNQPQHPQVQDAIQNMSSTCAAANIAFCAIPRQPGQIDAWRKQGVRAFLTGEDRGIIFRQLKRSLGELKTA